MLFGRDETSSPIQIRIGTSVQPRAAVGGADETALTTPLSCHLNRSEVNEHESADVQSLHSGNAWLHP